MDLGEMAILGFFIFTGFFFIGVVIWSIRTLRKKDDPPTPVHIRPSGLNQMQESYSTSANPMARQYGTYQHESPYADHYQYGWGTYTQQYPGQSVYTEQYQGQSDYQGQNAPPDHHEAYPAYPDHHEQYFGEVTWDEAGTEMEVTSPDPPRVVTRSPRIVSSSSADGPDSAPESDRIPPGPLALPSAGPTAWSGTDPTPPAGVFSDGLRNIAQMVGASHGTGSPGYPAFASSHPGSLGPGNFAPQDFYSIRDYSYSPDPASPSMPVEVEDYDSGDAPLPVLAPVEPPSVRVERREKPYKHFMDESTKCNICLGYIKTGLPLITCVCTKSYHPSCAVRMGYCPICGSDLLNYEDRTSDPSSKSGSFERIREAFQQLEEVKAEVGEMQVTDIMGPVDKSVATLTEGQKEKLRELLSKYDTTDSVKASGGTVLDL